VVVLFFVLPLFFLPASLARQCFQRRLTEQRSHLALLRRRSSLSASQGVLQSSHLLALLVYERTVAIDNSMHAAHRLLVFVVSEPAMSLHSLPLVRHRLLQLLPPRLQLCQPVDYPLRQLHGLATEWLTSHQFSPLLVLAPLLCQLQCRHSPHVVLRVRQHVVQRLLLLLRCATQLVHGATQCADLPLLAVCSVDAEGRRAVLLCAVWRLVHVSYELLALLRDVAQHGHFFGELSECVAECLFCVGR